VVASDIDTAGALQIAIEASPSGVLVVNPEGKIALVNRELERQFGYAREELVGQEVDVLLPESLGPIHSAPRDGFVQAPESRPMAASRELHARRKDGSLFRVEIVLNPFRTPNGLLVLASIMDVTNRRRSEGADASVLEAQRGFERFVAELSAQFINLPSERIYDAISNGLRRTCEQAGLDRATFYRVGQDSALVALASWTAPDVPSMEKPEGAMKPLPWSIEQARAGAVVSFATVSEIPSETDRDAYREAGTKSAVVVPVRVEGRVEGAVAFNAIRAERTWPPEVVYRLTTIARVFGEVLARQRREEAVRTIAAESQRPKDDLQVENLSLRRQTRERLVLTRVVGRSAALRRVLEQIEQVAQTEATVLLLGETGTGKELFATQIHELGPRQSRTMVRVNCAAIPAMLIESELFGREKGAYTGALSRQVGRFELAHHSTIFLDEIGDLPPDVQVKLLRVLEERQIERLGSPRPITVDTRIIAATHRNLEQRISDGTFREDLFYRLNVFPIYVPPLRERVEDIPLLVWRFVEEFSRAFGKRVDSIDKHNLAALQQYGWPGNIRELRNVVERAMIVSTDRQLSIQLPQSSAAPTRRSSRLVDIEREHIRGVLESTAWRIRGCGGAAERLGLKPTTLETRMAKLGITRPAHH
jgi:formate hydrogenlyase transcriptional activator